MSPRQAINTVIYYATDSQFRKKMSKVPLVNVSGFHNYEETFICTVNSTRAEESQKISVLLLSLHGLEIYNTRGLKALITDTPLAIYAAIPYILLEVVYPAKSTYHTPMKQIFKSRRIKSRSNLREL